jgi:hypothetical protein
MSSKAAAAKVSGPLIVVAVYPPSGRIVGREVPQARPLAAPDVITETRKLLTGVQEREPPVRRAGLRSSSGR